MNNTLVTYVTMSGSTAGLAAAIGEQLAAHGMQVDVLPIEKVSSLETYAAVVLGAPVAMGWHRKALRFLTDHRPALQRIPLAIFVTAMRLTATYDAALQGVRSLSTNGWRARSRMRLTRTSRNATLLWRTMRRRF